MNKFDLKPVLRLAVPSILENLLLSLVNIVDTAMVGSLGKEATAATAINAAPGWFTNALVLMVSIGTTVMVAQSWGAHDEGLARRYMHQGVALAAILGAIITTAALLLAPVIPIWMNAEPAIAPEATAYLRIISGGFLFNCIGITLFGVVRGIGNMRLPMLVTGGTNLLNVAGNFLLIYPTRQLWDGGPTMWGAGLGVRGAAISTAVSLACNGIFMLIILLRSNGPLRLHLRRLLRFDTRLSRNILRIGTPASGERVIITLGQIFFISIVSSLGTATLSAHHLAITAESICYNPAYGFQAAATTMVGQGVGAKDLQQAERYARINIVLCVLSMVLMGTLLYAFAPWIMRIFTPDAEVAALGAVALRIVAFSQPLLGLSLVTSGALRAAGDTLPPLWVAVICMWGVRVVLALFFVNTLNLGLPGAWYAMTIDLALRGIIIFARFQTGGWKKHALARAEKNTA